MSFQLVLLCIKYGIEFYMHCRKENKIQKRCEVLLCGAMNVMIPSCQLILTVDNLGPAEAGSHLASQQLRRDLSIYVIIVIKILMFNILWIFRINCVA
jgi:hypothetical protein